MIKYNVRCLVITIYCLVQAFRFFCNYGLFQLYIIELCFFHNFEIKSLAREPPNLWYPEVAEIMEFT